MRNKFCGNPANHGPHDEPEQFDIDLQKWKEAFHCDGVGRVEVEEEVIVEKFVPDTSGMSEMAEDGTDYYQMTVLIVDKHENVTVVNLPKVSYPRFLPNYVEYVDLLHEAKGPNPVPAESEIRFTPHRPDEGDAWTIEKHLKEEFSNADR